MGHITQNKLLLILITISLGFLSCETETPCYEHEQIEGAIIENANLGECFYFMEDSAYLVRSRSEYYQLQNNIELAYRESVGLLCDTLTMDSLVTIDFSQQSLLGLYAYGVGCDVGFHRKV